MHTTSNTLHTHTGELSLSDSILQHVPSAYENKVIGDFDSWMHIPTMETQDSISALDLMTHSAGFDQKLSGTVSDSSSNVQPISTFLPANMPLRIRPPKQVPVYSDYDAGLMALVLEKAGGFKSYCNYIRDHIFIPLKMSNTFCNYRDEMANLSNFVEPLTNTNNGTIQMLTNWGQYTQLAPSNGMYSYVSVKKVVAYKEGN